jgi:hypothetical protein
MCPYFLLLRVNSSYLICHVFRNKAVADGSLSFYFHQQKLSKIYISEPPKIPSGSRDYLEFISNAQTIATDNEHESCSVARTILNGVGASPVMDLVDSMLLLRKEILKVSNFLAENIRHFSYELFQDELDRCSQDAKKMIGDRLSKFLHEHSEAEEFSQALVKITIQIYIASFCASQWKPYLDQEPTTLHVGEYYQHAATRPRMS